MEVLHLKEITFYNVLNNPIAKVVLATSLLVSTGVSVATPLLTGMTQQVEAASSKTFSSTESTNQTQTQTFTISDITKLNKVTSNTGNVEVVGIVGEQVTVKMTGGTSSGTVQTGGTYVAGESKTATDTITNSSNSFATTKSYNSGGFSGTLSRSGSVSSTLISGSYTAPNSMTVTGQTSNYYNSGGYSGSLSQYLYSGSYTSEASTYVTNQSSTYYNSGGYTGSLSSYLHGYSAGDSKTATGHFSSDDGWPDRTMSYNSGGYTGTLYYVRSVPLESRPGYYRHEFSGTVTSPGEPIYRYQGTVTKPASDTRVYRYEGTVTKPAVDTRVYNYTQNYSGIVTKPAVDTRTYANTYQYNLTFDYETDIISPSISLTASSTTATNQNLEVHVNATDTGGLKYVKWAKGNQSEAYFATQGTTVSNNTFTVTENDVYTVFAEDLSGNKTIETISIHNIDTIAPALAVITANTTDKTNQDVMVSISYPVDAETKEYRLDDGSWTSYVSTLTLKANGKIEARSADAVGNQSEITKRQVENIDKVKPTIQAVSIVDEYLAVITNDVGSSVTKTEVKLNNSSYQDYQAKQIKLNQNTEVVVRVTDEAGNVTEETFSLISDVFYQDLLGQIDAIQKQIDTSGPTKSALEGLLIVVDKIKQDATSLVLPSEQTVIENKAKDLTEEIQAILDALDKAKVELEDLGDKPTQMELDKIQEIIDALPPGPDKDQLLKDLEDKQNQKDLQDAKDLVDNLGNNPTQVDIDHVRDVVKDLIDSDGKIDLLDNIKDKQVNLDKLVEEATKAVDELNDRSTQEDLQQAKDLVSKLPNGPSKETLLDKLKAKEKAIKDRLALDVLLAKAEAAVKHAETFPVNFNIDQAEKAVNILPSVPEKTSLLERIQIVKDNITLEEAKKKVEQAERYERNPYLEDAIKLVDGLKESNGKQALKDRLQVVLDKLKAIKDAEDAAKGDDGTFDPTNPDRSIEDAISTIQDLDAKNYLTRWHKANEHASNYFSRAMTANATKFQQELPASYLAKASYGNLIMELTARTENLAAAWLEASKNKVSEQLFSKAYTLVSLYESSKTERNYKNAVAAISDLPDGIAKKALDTQLTSLKNHLEEEDSSTLNSKEAIESTEKAVANYEKYKSSYYQKKAVESVELLFNSEEKIAFQTRLDLTNKK